MAKTTKYEVLSDFIDVQDNDYLYKKGRKFPRGNKKVDEQRLEQLLSADNVVGEPLIKVIEEDE